MGFDYGPKMGPHNLTHHGRQVNHRYLPNPGDRLRAERGKLSPKIDKKFHPSQAKNSGLLFSCTGCYQ